MTQNQITNLTQEIKREPLMGLLLCDPAGIVASEARGQREVVRSEILPTQLRDKAQFTAMGIEILGGVPNDPLFQYVTLPDGWTRHATEHYLWSEIRDERGRTRISVFYKAADYDRDAFATSLRRFHYGCRSLLGGDQDDGRGIGYVEDCGTVVFQTEPLLVPAQYPERGAVRDQLTAQAEAWLESHYPDYKNPLAYWDDEAPSASGE